MELSRENNFDLIRLFAAIQVVIGHTISHLELDFPILGKFLGPFPGVLIFFVISGFLITASFDRNKNNLKKYFKNRCLRIFPALWVSTFILILIMMFFGHVHSENIFDLSFVSWIFGQISVFQFYTPDLLRDFGCGSPNGSLWTISVEFSFYLLLPIIFYFGRKHLRSVISILLVLSIGYNCLIPHIFEGGGFYLSC